MPQISTVDQGPGSPGSGSPTFWSPAHSHASSIHAVAQPEALELESPGGTSRKFRKYQYEPLDADTQVRLIKLTHANKSTIQMGGDPMPECQIFHANLDDLPKYETISYAWGPLGDSMPIFVNGEYCLEITTGLWSAIDVFRHRTKPMVLWADQISINQHNLVERGHQVALMQRIYSQAQHTIIWLGPVDSVAKAAFDFIDKVSELPIDQHTVWRIGRDIVRFGEDVALARHSSTRAFLDAERPGLIALSNMLRRSWFTRMWCFQEVVVSKSILYFCGPYCCRWKDLYKAVGFCYSEENFAIGLSTTRETLNSREQYLNGNSDDLMDLLLRTSSCLCTDPRDKIFALLGVQSRQRSVDITADYSRTIRDVYMDTTTQIILRSQSLDVFGLRKEDARSEIPRLPTWVPDFSAINAPFLIDHSGQPKYSSSQRRPYMLDTPLVLGQLDVRGKVIDKVAGLLSSHLYSAAGDEASGVHTMFPTLLEILKGRMAAGASGFDSRLSDEAAQKLLRTLTVDCGGRWNRTHVEMMDNPEINMMFDTIQSLSPPGGDPWLQNFRSETRHCKTRALLALDTHHIALGPKYSAEGDLVCVLHGLSVPCVLRPMGHYYALIGLCFVDGAMYGEAVGWGEDEAEAFSLV